MNVRYRRVRRACRLHCKMSANGPKRIFLGSAHSPSGCTEKLLRFPLQASGQQMRRRDFITVAGSAAVWPLVARAQQTADRMRRIGVIVGYAEDDPEAQTRLAAFKKGLLTL